MDTNICATKQDERIACYMFGVWKWKSRGMDWFFVDSLQETWQTYRWNSLYSLMFICIFTSD